MTHLDAGLSAGGEKDASKQLDDITCRRIDHHDPADRERVRAILREYFASIGESEDADERYEWLYRLNPAGNARTFVATDRNTKAVVAVTSLFPRPVSINGRTFMGAIGGDGFVVPDYRRRGIATLLHNEALVLMSERDEPLSFMFGPPEPHNLKALLRAGAALTGSVQRFVRPLNWAGLGTDAPRLARPLRGPISYLFAPRRTRLRLEALGQEPDARVDRVWEETLDATAGRERIIPVRDALFYAWRFGRQSVPQNGYVVLEGGTPIAVCALERRGAQAAICDVTSPLRYRARAYRAILDACRGSDSVHTQIHVPATRERALLHALGFIPRTRKPFQVQVGPYHPEREALLRPKSWRYMWGDGDVTHVLA
jgi:GNAT superfamily N-acetyltransferase